MELLKSKKGQAVFESMGKLATGIAFVAIVLVVTFIILGKLGSQAVTDNGSDNFSVCTSYACNATRDTTNATQEVPGWLSIIIITAIGIVILGMVKGLSGRK